MQINIAENGIDNSSNVKVFMLKGEKGDPGVSPILTVTKSNGVATISITDADGTKSIQISDGEMTKAMVINNLLSDITDQPLSAYQGKLLKEMIDNKANTSDVYSKTDIDDLLDTKQNIALSGTSDPTNDLGTDGDIYLQYSE